MSSFHEGDCNGTGLPKQVFSREHWTKDVFNKEGVYCKYCHVVLEDSVMDTIKTPDVGEKLWLDHHLLNRNKKYSLVVHSKHSSRLACQVEVTRDFDGKVVFVCVFKSVNDRSLKK